MLHPKASNIYQNFLVTIDYFTEWVEAASFENMTKTQVTRFIKITSSINVSFHHSRQYQEPQQWNDGCLVHTIQNSSSKLKQNLIGTGITSCRLLFWPYQTSIRSSTWATLFSLVYSIEAVLSVEVEISLLQILMETGPEEAEWDHSRFWAIKFYWKEENDSPMSWSLLPEAHSSDLWQKG